jgi:hypothetical protein
MAGTVRPLLLGARGGTRRTIRRGGLADARDGAPRLAVCGGDALPGYLAIGATCHVCALVDALCPPYTCDCCAVARDKTKMRGGCVGAGLCLLLLGILTLAKLEIRDKFEYCWTHGSARTCLGNCSAACAG